MAASAEQKSFGSAEKSNTSGSVANGTATGVFAAVAGTKQYVQRVIFSFSGTPAAAVRATITYTYAGAAQTIGIQIPITANQYGIIDMAFAANPIEGDDNTAITATLPALGAGINGEACLIGYSRIV